MTHQYNIGGMTCTGCVAKVKGLLEQVTGVTGVRIKLEQGLAEMDMSTHVSTAALKRALSAYPKYQLSDVSPTQQEDSAQQEDMRSWIATYKPILLIFVYLSGITLLVELSQGPFRWHHWMNNFMGGFFLVFSFFKMLDLKGFAESYFSYDIIARKWIQWGYVYAFIELLLGIAYLSHFQPLLTNGVTFIVMTISMAGVLQSVLKRKKIKCACLGAVFNLPMSTVTIVEDALMIVMSAAMFRVMW